MSNKLPTALLIAAGVCLTGLPASAHHSGAMFDRTHMITLDATFMAQIYTNPHVWISVMGRPTGSKAKVVRWDIETVGPANLTRVGITRETLKPGDKIKVKINPLRDGRNGGSLVSVTTSDGIERGFKGSPDESVAPE